jgi:hypothetical protein
MVPVLLPIHKDDGLRTLHAHVDVRFVERLHAHLYQVFPENGVPCDARGFARCPAHGQLLDFRDMPTNEE